jgi:hypothetical protein
VKTCHIFEARIFAFQLLKDDWSKSGTKSCDLHGFCAGTATGVYTYINESWLNCIRLQPSIDI